MSYIKTKRLNVLIPHEVTTINPNYDHIGTRIQVAEQTDMDNGDLLVDKIVRQPDDIKRISADIDIDTETNIYVRYLLIFREKNTQQEIVGNFSVISSIHGDQEGFKFNNIIVTTPYVATSINNSSLNNSDMKITLEGFQVLVGLGKHKSTSWLITDSYGNDVFKREKDEDNLTSIVVPYKLFDNTKLYLIKAKFNTDTNGSSNFGCYVLNTSTIEKYHYTLEPVLPFLFGQSLFYKATYKTNMIRNLGIVVKQVLGDVEVEVFRKDDYLPSRSIKIPNDNLVEGATYRTYSFAKMMINGNIVTTSTSLYHTFVYNRNNKTEDNPSADYPGKYTKLNTLTLGGAVVVSRELKNGTFLLAKNSHPKFSIYGRYLNTVRDTGLEVDMPEPVTLGDLFVPYLNVLPLYDDRVMINYCTYKSGTNYRSSVWAIYDVDLVTNKWTLLKHKVFPDELYSTAMSSSAVVGKDNIVYYVPARYEPTKGNPELLPVFKIEYKNRDLVRTKIEDEAIPRNLSGSDVYRNVTMIAVDNFKKNNNEQFIVLGGTDKTGTPILDQNGNQTGGIQYRLNNLVAYNIGTDFKDNQQNLRDKLGELPANFDLDLYNLSAFLRKDGKMVLFNNCDAGTKSKDSESFVTENVNNGYFTSQSVHGEGNESTIDLPFRTTLVCENGDFIRISYKDDIVMHTLLYPHVKLANYEDDIITFNKNLVVPVGRTVTIENPYLYDTIVIEGTDDQNTGILRWADQNFVRTLTYKDVILTRDTVHTQAQADLIPKQHLWILDGVTYTIKG